MDAVPACLRPDVDDAVADALGLAVKDIVLLCHAQAEDVHQRIPAVAILEMDFAAHRRHADAVSVTGDSGHHTCHQAAVLGVGKRAEAERVEQRNRPRAHGEDIAQDTAHARRRALGRFDKARVVVRFDLEDGHVAVADVHDAGVFPRPLEDARAAGGQARQMHLGTFVATVLAPHDTEDAELGQVRLAAHQRDDAPVLFLGQIMLLDDIRCNGFVAHVNSVRLIF